MSTPHHLLDNWIHRLDIQDIVKELSVMTDKTTSKQLKRFIEIDEANRQRGIGVSFFIFLYMDTICDVY